MGVWHGATGVIPQPDSPHYKFANGIQATVHYKGQLSVLLANKPEYGDTLPGFAGMFVVEVDIQRDGTGANMSDMIVQIKTPGSSGGFTIGVTPEPTVRLTWQVTQKDIRLHPYFNQTTPIDGSGGGLRLIVDDMQEIDKKLKDEDYDTTNYGTNPDWFTNPLPNKMYQLYARLRSGLTSYDHYVPVGTYTQFSLTSPETGQVGTVVADFSSLPAKLKTILPQTSPGVSPYKYILSGDEVQFSNNLWERTRTWIGHDCIDVLTNTPIAPGLISCPTYNPGA
jgi:hypothetical protein